MHLQTATRSPTELSSHLRHVAFQRRIAAAAAKVMALGHLNIDLPPVKSPAVVRSEVATAAFIEAWGEMPRGEIAEAPPVATASIVPLHLRRIEEIQKLVAKAFGVSREDILSARRMIEIVRIRQLCMYLCKEHTNRSLPDIGRRFGGRDHTTVLHAVRKMEVLVRVDPVIAQNFAELSLVIESWAA